MKYLLLISTFLISCASVQTLDGGKKDVTPPIVIKATPDSASLYINSKEFTFQFDEYVKTTKVNDLLIISPNQSLSPELKIKGKKLYLKLKNDLKPYTTYSFQFNGSIVDVNESNPLIDYSYIFSTGDYLDSLSINGFVKHAESNEVCNDCNIHLYKSKNDSVILSSKPQYTTKTNEQGFYIFYNLPHDTFRLVAIQDKNKNLVLDKDEEVSLFINKNTTLTTIDTVAIFPLPNKDKLKAQIITPFTPGIIKIKLNRIVDTSDLQLTVDNKIYTYDLTQTLDTIKVFYKPEVDTTILSIINKKDTILLDYILPLSKLKYTPKINAYLRSGVVDIRSNVPINSVDTSKIKLMSDSNTINFSEYVIFKTKLLIPFNSKQTPDKLILEKEAIKDVFNKVNNEDTILLNIPPIKNTLIIDYQVTNPINYLIYIMRDNKIIRLNKLTQSKKIKYYNLKAGQYSIKIIADINNNGIWDTGDLFLKKEPEPIQFSNPFEVRDNWDKELIINLL